MKDLTPFLEKLKSLFSDSEGLSIEYYRTNDSTTQLYVWMQKHLDELAISEFSFMVIDGEIVVKSYKYELDPVGFDYFHFPFEIELFDETKEFTPKNIKKVSVVFK